MRALGITSIERVGGADRFATSAAIGARATRALAEARDRRISETKGVLTDAIAEIQAQLDTLAVRIGGVEDGVEVLGGRIEMAEGGVEGLEGRVGALEAAGGGGDDDFWPEVDIEVDELERGVYGYVGPDSFELQFDLPARITHRDSGLVIDDRVMSKLTDSVSRVVVMRVEGEEYWGTLYLNGPAAEAPTAGTPIEVEYWIESYGERAHGVRTLTDWEYDE